MKSKIVFLRILRFAFNFKTILEMYDYSTVTLDQLND